MKISQFQLKCPQQSWFVKKWRKFFLQNNIFFISSSRPGRSADDRLLLISSEMGQLSKRKNVRYNSRFNTSHNRCEATLEKNLMPN